MAAPKGHAYYGGRKKGTPNKKTEMLGNILSSLKFDPVERLIKLYPTLAPEVQVKINLELIGYLYPRKKAIELAGDQDAPVGLSITSEDKIKIAAEVRDEMRAERKK